MQLKIFIDLKENLELPINYNHILQGIIYHSAETYNKNYVAKLHDIGIQNDVNSNYNFKLFTFSKIIGKKSKVEGNRIIFLDSIFWEIRSVDAYFIHLLYMSFSQNGINFGNVNIKPRLKLENKVITDDRIHIRMLSPISVVSKSENNKSIFLSPNDINFEKCINTNFENKYNSYYNTFPHDEIEITPDYISYKDKVITTIKGIYITAWNGTFFINSSPDLLTFLYNCGLGSKNSSGFGMFNILDN